MKCTKCSREAAEGHALCEKHMQLKREANKRYKNKKMREEKCEICGKYGHTKTTCPEIGNDRIDKANTTPLQNELKLFVEIAQLTQSVSRRDSALKSIFQITGEISNRCQMLENRIQELILELDKKEDKPKLECNYEVIRIKQ